MVESKVAGQITILYVRGKMTAGETDLRSAIQEALNNGSHIIVLNLQDVTRIDSSGIADLVSGRASATQRGGRVAICSTPQKMKALFTMTQLDTVFDMYDTEAEALASVQST